MGERRATSLSPPERFLLDAWGATLRRAFDATPYLVGSVERGDPWRDVDVRMLLDDDRYEALARTPLQLAALNVAVSTWGQRATGLPIDFQFQRQDEANVEYAGQRRNALISHIERVS